MRAPSLALTFRMWGSQGSALEVHSLLKQALSIGGLAASIINHRMAHVSDVHASKVHGIIGQFSLQITLRLHLMRASWVPAPL